MSDEYQAISECMSNGTFRTLESTEPNLKDLNGDHKSEPLSDQSIYDKLIEQIESIDRAVAEVNGIKISPKPSPRVLPKPPQTKPEIPKNKPQM